MLATASICTMLMYFVAIVLPQYFVMQCMRFRACPPVAAGRAIRYLAGRHSSHSTSFLPTVAPLAGPARLSRVAIMLPLSNPCPWFYNTRYRRRRFRPTILLWSLIAPRALPNMSGALRSEAKHPVRSHLTIGWHLEIGLM